MKQNAADPVDPRSHTVFLHLMLVCPSVHIHTYMLTDAEVYLSRVRQLLFFDIRSVCLYDAYSFAKLRLINYFSYLSINLCSCRRRRLIRLSRSYLCVHARMYTEQPWKSVQFKGCLSSSRICQKKTIKSVKNSAHMFIASLIRLMKEAGEREREDWISMQIECHAYETKLASSPQCNRSRTTAITGKDDAKKKEIERYMLIDPILTPNNSYQITIINGNCW